MDEILKKDFFRTSDFLLCCVLSYFDYPIVEMDRSDPKRVHFIMKKGTGFDETVQKFWSKAITVEPISFSNTIKEVKGRIYNG